MPKLHDGRIAALLLISVVAVLPGFFVNGGVYISGRYQQRDCRLCGRSPAAVVRIFHRPGTRGRPASIPVTTNFHELQRRVLCPSDR